MSTFSLIIFLLNIVFVGYFSVYLYRFIKFYKDPCLVSRKRMNLNIIFLIVIGIIINIIPIILRVKTLI